MKPLLAPLWWPRIIFTMTEYDRSRYRPCTKLWRNNCRGIVGLNNKLYYRGKTDRMTWVGPPLSLDPNHRQYVKRRVAAAPNPCGGLS